MNFLHQVLYVFDRHFSERITITSSKEALKLCEHSYLLGNANER